MGREVAAGSQQVASGTGFYINAGGQVLTEVVIEETLAVEPEREPREGQHPDQRGPQAQRHRSRPPPSLRGL